MDPVKYKSIFNGFSVTLREDGVRGLGKGWAPTFIGYSMQGLCKFGFYEVFKSLYNDMLGEVSLYIWDTNKTENERELIWVCKDCSKIVNLIYFSNLFVIDHQLTCVVWFGLVNRRMLICGGHLFIWPHQPALSFSLILHWLLWKRAKCASRRSPAMLTP